MNKNRCENGRSTSKSFPTYAGSCQSTRTSRQRDTHFAFFGFYGRNNFGDDLFGYLLQEICARTPGARALVVGASARRELTTGFNLPIARQLWNRDGVSGAVARVTTYVAGLLRADVAVFGGGSLFGAHASKGFASLIVTVSARLFKPVAAMGVSVGPFECPSDRDAFSVVLQKLKTVAVRDESSVSELTRITGNRPLNLSDLAFSLPAVYTPRKSDSEKRRLIVSLHLREYTDTVLAILHEADEQMLVDEVVFLSLDDESVGVTGDVARLFVPENVVVSRFKYTDSITQVIDLIASASCVITSKLHGGICSFVYGVPALLFCYQRKCAEFLDDNGLPGPRERLPAEEVCVGLVKALLANGRTAPSFTRAQMHLDAFSAFLAALRRNCDT